MRKLLNNPWLVGPLACVALGLVAWRAFTPLMSVAASDTHEGSRDDQEGEASNPVTVAATLGSSEMFVAAGTRDPFAARAETKTVESRETTSESNLETLKLAAVWLQGSEAFVAINARICRVGDTVAGAVVESVTREGAWLTLPSGREFLRIGREVSFSAAPKRPLSVLVVSREP